MGGKMTVVSGVIMGGGFSEAYDRSVSQRTDKDLMKISKKRTNYSRAVKEALKDESYLGLIKTEWDSLSGPEQGEWNDGGVINGITGYQLFTQDTIYRMAHGIPGLATFSYMHQYKINYIHVPVGAGDVLFRQTGNTMPVGNINLLINYKATMNMDIGTPYYIKLRFRYYEMYGGVKIAHVKEVTLSESTDWTSGNGLEIPTVDMLEEWEFEIAIHNLEGDFWFDNTYAYDENGIITLDPHCNRGESKWLGLTVPTGTTLDTIYPTA